MQSVKPPTSSGGGLSSPMDYEASCRASVERAKKTIEESIDIAAKAHAIGSIGSAARSTHDPKFAEECIHLLGGYLTDEKCRFVRHSIASALGFTQNPAALKYLEGVLTSDEGKETTGDLRANAVGAVGVIMSHTHYNGPKSAFEEGARILQYVAENDRYRAKALAVEILKREGVLKQA